MNKLLTASFLVVYGFATSAHAADSKAKDSKPAKAVEKTSASKDPEAVTSKCSLTFKSFQAGKSDDKGEVIGTVTVGVFGNTVPKTANNFMVLCAGNKFKDPATGKVVTDDKKFEKPLYKDSVVHRVIPKFMIQAGDFQNNNGTGGYSIYGAKFPDENFTIKHISASPYGSLSMANAGPNTNGSQFFITVANTDWLNGKHVVFGKVMDAASMEVAKKIEALGSESGETKGKVIKITDTAEVK